MREILFRGKRVDNGEWIYGDYGRYAGTHGIEFVISIINIDCPEKSSCFEVIPESVGQYTGLKDKNGNKIFEGDILEGFWFGEGTRGEVCWIDKIASVGIRYSFRAKDQVTAWINAAWCKTLDGPLGPVVIGNIHDNPELLEVE